MHRRRFVWGILAAGFVTVAASGFALRQAPDPIEALFQAADEREESFSGSGPYKHWQHLSFASTDGKEMLAGLETKYPESRGYRWRRWKKSHDVMVLIDRPSDETQVTFWHRASSNRLEVDRFETISSVQFLLIKLKRKPKMVATLPPPDYDFPHRWHYSLNSPGQKAPVELQIAEDPFQDSSPSLTLVMNKRVIGRDYLADMFLRGPTDTNYATGRRVAPPSLIWHKNKALLFVSSHPGIDSQGHLEVFEVKPKEKTIRYLRYFYDGEVKQAGGDSIIQEWICSKFWDGPASQPQTTPGYYLRTWKWDWTRDDVKLIKNRP